MAKPFRISGKSFKYSSWAILVAGAVLMGTLWTNVISTYRDLEAQALQDLQSQASKLTEALRLQTDSILRGLDTVAIQLRREYQTQGQQHFQTDTRTFIESALEGFAVQVVVVDKSGQLAWSSQATSHPLDLTDRHYFLTHAQTPEADRLYIGNPIQNRISHLWTIPVSRPLLSQGGSPADFNGVIMISLNPLHFARIFQQVELGQNGIIALLSNDGTYLVRSSPDDNWVGRQLPASAPIRKLQADKGNFRQISYYDGQERIYAYRRMPAYGIVLVTGLGTREALAQIQLKARNSYATAFLVTLITTALFLYLFRVLQRHAETEAELEAEHHILQEAERIGQVGSWQWDLNSKQIIGSEQLHRMFCFDKVWGAIPPIRFQERIHPDDRKRVKAVMGQALREHTSLPELEYRILCPDGSEKTVLAYGEYLADEEGPQMIGTLQDVTQLRASQKQLMQAKIVFDNAQEALVVADPGGIILAVNPAFERITGYAAEEALGKKTSLLSSGRHPPLFFGNMWSTLEKEGHWEGEIWNRRKNGSLYVEWLTIQAVYAENGQTQQYVALFSDITDRKRQEEAVWHRAYHDALTGLPNRSLFQDRLEHALESAQRDNHQLAVLFIDLDHFKEINDTLGHALGDELLRQVAERLQSGIRSSDTVARLAGDEFMALLENIDDCNSLPLLAEKILAQLIIPFQLQTHQAHISGSIGIAVYPDHGRTREVLLHAADQAMYEAKRRGRNAYAFAEGAPGARGV